MSGRDSGPDPTLPERWGVWQRNKNTLIYWTLRGLYLGLALVPFAVLRQLCRLLGFCAWLVAVSERRRAAAHLAASMPELSAGERRRIVRRMFVHLGESAAEMARLERFLVGRHAVLLSDAHKKVLDDALAAGHGAVAVTGHIGNWELLAQVVGKAGYPAASIAKPLYDPRLTLWAHRARTAHGLDIIWRGKDGGVKEMLRVFKRNGILGLLIDQDTKVQSAFVPFFGRAASTPTAAARFALRFDAPIVMAWNHRVGGKHVLHFERLEPVRAASVEGAAADATAREEADIVATTAAMTARLEHAIRQHPEQWVWMHRRWKTQPPT